MIKFDSNNIIVGYIKELLHSFNLPACRIKPFSDTDHLSDTHYIDDTHLYYVDRDGNKEEIMSYYFNAKLPLNLERHLRSKEIYYDTITHKYLGDYLRYLRDYAHINLMSLYNCFSNKIIDINLNVGDNEFNSNDIRYKIYAIPVKFNQKYTIAVSCADSIEIACGFYDNDVYTGGPSSKLSSQTYLRKIGTHFHTPFVYDKLDNLTSELKGDGWLAAHEDDLYLFLKVPATNTSSIVVLEGDFTLQAVKVSNNNVQRPDMTAPLLIRNHDKSIIKDILENNIELPTSTRSQLLQYNTGTNYPFADKLIGYLLDNTVTPIDTITDNFKRIRAQLLAYLQVNNKTLYDYLRVNLPKLSWNNVYNMLLSDIEAEKSLSPYNNEDNFDILGYFDKDIENMFDEIDIYGDMNWKESDR